MNTARISRHVFPGTEMVNRIARVAERARHQVAAACEEHPRVAETIRYAALTMAAFLATAFALSWLIAMCSGFANGRSRLTTSMVLPQWSNQGEVALIPLYSANALSELRKLRVELYEAVESTECPAPCSDAQLGEAHVRWIRAGREEAHLTYQLIEGLELTLQHLLSGEPIENRLGTYEGVRNGVRRLAVPNPLQMRSPLAYNISFTCTILSCCWFAAKWPPSRSARNTNR